MNNNCTHVAGFYKESKVAGNGVIRFHVWTISSMCSLCNRTLDEKELEVALEHTYSPEVAQLVYQTFTNLAEYYSKVSELSARGIQLSLTPEIPNS